MSLYTFAIIEAALITLTFCPSKTVLFPLSIILVPSLSGVQEKKVKVEIRKFDAESKQISFNDIESAIQSENTTIGAGNLKLDGMIRPFSKDFVLEAQAKQIANNFIIQGLDKELMEDLSGYKFLPYVFELSALSNLSLEPISEYNKSIPTPKSIIGHEVGEFHISHDKLSHYVQEISKKSNRVKLINRGQSYENRTSWLMIITSESNHLRLEEIRKEHIELSNSKNKKINVSNMPVVVYQGFSVHGDEPSGSNASLPLMYHLLASDSDETTDLLKNTIILLDPSLNPDGLQRFSQWANSNKNQSLNPDSNDREYNQYWPRGRTNHYWFDLNRDYLPNQLIETKAKIQTYTKWLPNIMTDHHEMGTNSSFFFQPGVQERKNPLISDLNQELTREIGTYHEDALNEIGSLYYSEEDYDDFYFGKGSSYPDINGGIGILFEQGSSRGHIQESVNGILTFPFTIRNQLTAAFSTLKAARNMRVKLLNYMKDFFDDQVDLNPRKSENIIFGKSKDKSTVYHLADVLNNHKIKFNNISEDIIINGNKYSKDNSYIIPMNQPKRTLIKGMFNTQTKFQDSLFYDVSAWTFPLAFNINYDYTDGLSQTNISKLIDKQVDNLTKPNGFVNAKSEYAYIFEPHEYYTQAAIYKILEHGLRVKTATRKFSINGKKYDYGTYMIQVQNQKLNSDEIYELLNDVSKNYNIRFESQPTGITDGIDLGSDYFIIVKKPKCSKICIIAHQHNFTFTFSN